MSEKEEQNTASERVESKQLVSEEQNTLSIIANRIMGGEMNDLDKDQIDNLIKQRGQVYEYIHNDRTQESYDNKYYFTGIVVAMLLIVGAVIWQVPEFTTEVLALLIGLVGGYGFGKQK